MYSLLSGRSHGAMTYTYIPKKTQKATREHNSPNQPYKPYSKHKFIHNTQIRNILFTIQRTIKNKSKHKHQLHNNTHKHIYIDIHTLSPTLIHQTIHNIYYAPFIQSPLHSPNVRPRNKNSSLPKNTPHGVFFYFHKPHYFICNTILIFYIYKKK